MKQSTFSAVMANSIKNLLQGYTKGIRLIAVLTLLLTVGIGQVWGADVTYTVSKTNAVTTSGTAPTNSTAAYSQTFNTACQITSGNSATLTLTNLGGINISNITLSMKSNKSAGAGKLSYSTDGGSTWTYLVGSSSSGLAFNNTNWNGSYTQTYTDISKTVSLSNVTKLKIKIEATTNSLYCQSYKITYTAASSWKLKGSWDGWTEHAMTVNGTEASCKVTLAAGKRYEFGFDGNGTFYKNNGVIIVPISGWVFNTSDGNCKLHTGPAGEYTFKINTSNKQVTVIYPEVTHPHQNYVYFKNSDVWGTVKGYLGNTGNSNKASEWPGIDMPTTIICDETYHYGALSDCGGLYNVIIFNNGNSGYGNQTSDLTVLGSGGKYNANRDANWHDFTTYTITFSGNGNTGGSMSNVTGIPCDGSTTLVTNGYTRTGYTFNNWKTNVAVTANSSSVDANGSVADKATISNITSNITLTAQWKANTYTITYKDGGNTNFSGTHESGYPTTHTYGTATTLKNATKTGYIFEGWYKESTCTNKVTSLGANAYTANITLYAKWTPITYYVQFNGNGSTGGSMSNQTFKYGTAQNLTPNAFTRTGGYTFAGWNTKEDGSGTNYADKASVNNLSTTNGAIVNLYAKWTKVHTITWKVNGQQYGEKQEVEDGQTIGSLPDAPDAPASCSGKVFMGWTESATVDSDGNNITYINSSTKPNSDKTYHAVFATETSEETTTTISKTKIEDFEKQTNSNEYNTTKTYTAANSNAGIAWKMYYGTVSTNAVLNGSKSAQMRWYSSASANLPYVQTTAIVKGLKSISFKTLTSDNDYKYSVSYSTNNSTWTNVATSQSVGSTSSTQTKSYTINANGVDAYIKIAITSTSNVTDKATFRIDDVVFTYLESTTTTETKHSDYVTSCTPQYTITLDLNGGVFDETPDGWKKVDENTYTQVVNENTAVTLPTPTKIGYTYKGWRKNNTGNPVSSITASETATYTASYDCAIRYVAVEGTYALVSGQKFELTAIAQDENHTPLECPDDATYTWQRKDAGGNWVDVTGNESTDKTKLIFNSCEVAHCGTYRCHITYGDCGAYSNPQTGDDGYRVHVFHLKGNFENNWNKEYTFTATANVGIATLSIDLVSGHTHEFKIYDGIYEYGNSGTISASVTDWPYGSDNNSNTILQTGADGTYVFTLDFTQLIDNSTNVLFLDVTYPPSNQSEGYTVYYDNLVHNWQNVYYRIGHTGHNMNSTMELVPGTSHLYKCITPQYDDFEAWQVANNVAWSGEHSIYNVNTNDQYAITHATEYKKFVVVEDITLTPDADGTFVNGENCTYYPAAKQAGMKKHNATVIPATGGTITVSYTDHDGTAKSDFTSGDRDLAHTCLLTITATPDAGYSLGTLTVNDVPFTSGNVHTLAEDAVIKVVWTEKATPTFAWSAATCTAALEADNTFPTLNNPNTLPVTYTSSNTDVATIDANGNITLVATGTTTITADGAETATHKSATTPYELTVVESNCKWVEVEIGDIDENDQVVIAMAKTDGTKTWALDNSETGTYPAAGALLVEGNKISQPLDKYIWNIVATPEGYVLYSYADKTTWLYCTGSNNTVKVGTGSDKKFVIENGYLKCSNQLTVSGQLVDAYIGVSSSTNSWRHYPNTTGVIKDQTLKFYKRECLDSEHYWVTWDAGEGTWEDKSSKKLESYQEGATITEPTDPTREGYRFDGWTPNPGTMPAQNTTFTAKWTKVYTITWYENGVPSYTYVPSDNPVVTWEDDIADCGTKKFYGWTADDTFVSDPTTPPTLISKGTTIAGDVTYYAVYADAEEPANPGYEKVTNSSNLVNGVYIIAAPEVNYSSYSKQFAYAGDNDNDRGACVEVTFKDVDETIIASKPNEAQEIIVDIISNNKFTMHYASNKYLKSTTSGNYLYHDEFDSDNDDFYWTLDNENKGRIFLYKTPNTDNRYLISNANNSGTGLFACYKSTNGGFTYLYKKQTTTYTNFAVSCATYEITITPPTGGTVTTTPAYEAGAGQTITVNVTPDDCKYLTALKYNKYNDGSDYSINISSTPYTFTMPAADVTVTATFADKTATDIEVITSAHRMLMQGSAFVGEQVRITYNNGDKETLNWNDSRLTFTGHNTATLGSQTVTVTYNDCGTQSASYNIEVIDGLGITFWDGNYTEVVKYEPGDLVDVDSRIGQNICSGWEFAGWSETKVANESEEYVPVHNFNATDAKVLYAVYVKKKAQWTTIVTADEAKSGAKYVLAYDRYDTYYALTSSVKDVNYLAGKVVTSTEGELNSFDVYYLSAEPTADLIWELISTDENGKWYLYNKNTAKYIDLSTQGQIHLTDLPSDKLQMESGYNDSQIRIASSTVPTYYLSWDNSNTRYNTFASSNSQEYWYTKDEEFTSTPPCSPLSATFHGNGGIVTAGVNSGDDLTITEPTRDAGITTPTASFADCNGKSWTFVGWSREEIDVTRVPVLTTDLLHDGGGNNHYYIQEDGEEFWAVYTNTGDPETKYGTITFTDDDVTTQYENAKTITKSVTAMGDYDFELYHVSDASSLGIQFDHNSTPKGYIKNITSLGKINSISLNDFQVGDIDDVKVYVGNTSDAINILLTEADLQQTGNTYTYYPQKNYAYVKIEANGYCGITSISIDFGKGTQIWATTPDCSTITLSGDEIYITATNGRAIMASAPIAVKANQLEANANVILTSTSSDVYFSTDRTFNFAAGQAAGQKPTTSLTLPTNAEGNLATTDVYIHYMPSSEGDGVPANVIISANLETPNPSITDDHTIHVRNLPAKFVIATKVGATWYALPADMTDDTNPLAEVIEVDEATMTATAPNTTTYTLWPVKTTNGTGNRYADYGDRLRFAAVNYEQRGLWANNNNSSSAIRNYAVINSLGADALAAYEWKVTTTVVDGHWQYTLQTDQTQNQNYLRYWTSAEGTPVGPKWGTYNAGENKLYFLPVTETQPFEYAVVEWYPTKMLIQTDAAITSPTVKVRGEEVATPVLTSKGGKLYEISNLPLETNPNEVLQVSFTADAVNYVNAKVVPIILSRGAKSITGEPFATLTQKVYQYADVVVRDEATLTIDGGTDVANTLLSVTIYPTAKVSVAEGKKLSVHSLTFFGGIDEIYDGSTYTINKYDVPQLSLKGILNKTVTNMDYIMRVNLDQMYQVGVPYDVNLSDITYWDGTTMTLGDNLYVSAYDGQKRANREEKSWVWETDFTEKVLKAGIGYTISADKQDAAHEYSIIRMPMKNNITSGNTETAKTVQVYAYNNTNSVEITDNHKGWNYLSNPYMVAISGAEADSKLVVGYLRETGTGPWEWVDDTYRYVTIPSDDGKWYDQQKFEEATLLPFKSFFLQIATDGELSFALASRQNAPARYLQSSNEQREVEFEVLLANDTRSDNLGFLIGEDYTPAYEINADLEKMIGSMSVYTIYNGYNLAYNALSPANAEEQIPIGYVVPTVGEYTFALDESSDIEDVEHIYLIDYETSAITDLVTDVYTFTTLEQKSDTRFAINVALKSKDNAATGLDNMNTNGELPTKFIYQDKIFILHHGVIYDATGKRVITINK